MWRDCDVDAIFVILLSLLTVIVEVSPIINMVIAVIYSLLTGSLFVSFHIQNDSVLLRLKLLSELLFNFGIHSLSVFVSTHLGF